MADKPAAGPWQKYPENKPDDHYQYLVRIDEDEWVRVAGYRNGEWDWEGESAAFMETAKVTDFAEINLPEARE